MSHKLIHDVSAALGEVEARVFQLDYDHPFAESYTTEYAKTWIEGTERAKLSVTKRDYLTYAAAILIRMIADMPK